MTDFAATNSSPAQIVNPVARYALIGAGSVFVTIGVIGIFVPLLPTTIFLLIAAACFGRSSPGAHHWLTTNRWFGSYLHDYQERRGATLWTKISTVAFLWLGIGAAMYFLALPLWLTAILLVIAAAVSAHLVSLKTLRD